MIRAVVLLAVVLAGCAIDPPQGFVALPVGGELQLLAVAPSGSRMRVREVANAEGGSLSFWGAAIQRELVQGRGYALLESVPVTTASGEMRAGGVLTRASDGRACIRRWSAQAGRSRGGG